jgi:hypothetical protein
MTPNTFCVLLGVHYIAWTFFYAISQDIRPLSHAFSIPDCAQHHSSHQGGLGAMEKWDEGCGR